VPRVLSDVDRQKIDTSDDTQFYELPRFVTHADDAFTARLTEVYESKITPGDRVFDAMSSWVSFLPDIPLEYVVGHGLNEAELEANDRLDEYFLQDFNSNQTLPLDENSFDVVCCALSVQYLDQHYESLFSYIVGTAFAAQAKRYTSNGMMGGVPAITAAVEVAGYMRYFVDQHPVPSGAYDKFEEILSQQLGNQHGAELLLSTGDFSSELWFAQNVFELGHAVEFSTDATAPSRLRGIL